MKPFNKVYELTYKHPLFYVYKKITFFGFTISKTFLGDFTNPETAVKFMKSITR